MAYGRYCCRLWYFAKRLFLTIFVQSEGKPKQKAKTEQGSCKMTREASTVSSRTVANDAWRARWW
jgi:hypothetical protein